MLPGNDGGGCMLGRGEADKHLPPLSLSPGSLPQPCCLGPEERDGRTRGKARADPWLGAYLGTAGDGVFGTVTGRGVGGLSPPGIVVQRSFPLLQGQMPLHRGLCKLLCSWLEQKAQEPSGDRQTKPGDLLSGSARVWHASLVSNIKCPVPLTS